MSAKSAAGFIFHAAAALGLSIAISPRDVSWNVPTGLRIRFRSSPTLVAHPNRDDGPRSFRDRQDDSRKGARIEQDLDSDRAAASGDDSHRRYVEGADPSLTPIPGRFAYVTVSDKPLVEHIIERIGYDIAAIPVMISSIFLAIYGIIVIAYAQGGGATGLADRFWFHTVLTAAAMWAIGPIARALILRALAKSYRTVEIPDDAHTPLVDEVLP